MLNLALWLKRNHFCLDQVKNFLPTPLVMASAMYHSGRNPLRTVRRDSDEVRVPKGERQRRLHKVQLRYHDHDGWPQIRNALHAMDRADLIGYGKRCLVPPRQPASATPNKNIGKAGRSDQANQAGHGARQGGQRRNQHSARPAARQQRGQSGRPGQSSQAGQAGQQRRSDQAAPARGSRPGRLAPASKRGSRPPATGGRGRGGRRPPQGR